MASRNWVPEALALLRVSTALVFLQHGTQKLFGFPVAPIAGYQHLSLAGLAGLMEVVAVPFLLLGLWVRPISFVMSGLMAVGYFMGHAWGKRFYPIANGGDVAVLCCFIFLFLAAAGGGAWCLDRHAVLDKRSRVVG